jgi:hypothetical protein
MKKLIFFLLFCSYSYLSLSQAPAWSWVSGSSTDIHYSAGLVGIGNPSPAHQLDVKRISSTNGTNAGIWSYSEQTASNTGNVSGVSAIAKATHTSGTVTLGIGISGSIYNSGGATMSGMRAVQGNCLLQNSSTVTNGYAFFGLFGGSTGTLTNAYGLYIDPFPSVVTNKWGVYINDASAKNYFGGSVAIGTTSDYGYKLAVNGSAIFTEAKVKLYANWPDYVFHKDYKLLPLSELQKFIEKNHHLPNIPSAREVQENEGIELGKMSAKLLQKIEELTLYILELKKENEEIKQTLKSLTGN